jgi:hypothetical protein
VDQIRFLPLLDQSNVKQASGALEAIETKKVRQNSNGRRMIGPCERRRTHLPELTGCRVRTRVLY